MLWVAVGTLVLTVLLYVLIPKGFFPLQDTGLVQATIQGPPSISFHAMTRRQQALAEVLVKDPDVESLSRRSSASTAPTRRSTTGAC